MTPVSFRSSRADNWTSPRSSCDPCQRRLKHGAIRPMEDSRGFLARWLGWN